MKFFVFFAFLSFSLIPALSQAEPRRGKVSKPVLTGHRTDLTLRNYQDMRVKPGSVFRVFPILQFKPKCAEHYTYVSGSSTDTECHGYVQPGFGSIGAHAVTGGYTCRFTGDYPAANACPDGTMIHRYSSTSYDCVSDSDIAVEDIKCAEGFTLENQPSASPGVVTARNRISCRDKIKDPNADSIPENVCADSEAQLVGGSGHDNCCVYLEQ